jgi:hypothetical protein
VIARQHLVGGLDDRAGQLGIQQPEIAVDLGRRALDHRLRPHEGWVGLHATDREVGHSALSLGAEQRVGRHAHFAQRVLFSSIFLRHRGMPPD